MHVARLYKISISFGCVNGMKSLQHEPKMWLQFLHSNRHVSTFVCSDYLSSISFLHFPSISLSSIPSLTRFLKTFFPGICHVMLLVSWQKQDTKYIIAIIDYWFFHYVNVRLSSELTINRNFLSHLPFILLLFTFHHPWPEPIAKNCLRRTKRRRRGWEKNTHTQNIKRER